MKSAAQDLLNIIKTSGLIDYRALSTKTSLENYLAALEASLQIAEKHFAQLLKTPESQINFKQIVEKYLEIDTELDLLYSFMHNFNATDSSPKTREIIEKFQPRYTEFSNKVSLSREYYELVKKLAKQQKIDKNFFSKKSALSQSSATSKALALRKNFEKKYFQHLSPAQKRSLELIIQGLKFSGVHLSGTRKKRLEEINKRLAELKHKFANNCLDDRARFFYQFKTTEGLEEIPAQDLESARHEAKNRKLTGYVFTLSPPSLQAILKYCSNRKIRQKFFIQAMQVAGSGKFDNRPLILEILNLRREKARLLGFPNYAEYKLQYRMAERVKNVKKMLEIFSKKAFKKAKKDLKELEKFARASSTKLQKFPGTLENWDIAYYSEKLRKEKFHIDQKELQNYFSLEQTVQGMFNIAGKLYQLTFKKIPQAHTYDKDSRVFQVYHGKKLISWFILDLYARSSKQPGAWANLLRNGSQASKTIPITINVCNFDKSKSKKPTLLTYQDVRTLFHEFGHALHAMLSHSEYENLSGFHTEWDFVELPSQFMENWCLEPEGLNSFARHFETRKKIPDQLEKALVESRTFMSGYYVLRQCELGYLDILLHTEALPKTVVELDKKCLEISQKYSIIKKPPTYKMYASFSHIFGGGYGAGYYSYLWSEILEADCFTRFRQAGIFNQRTGADFAEKILEAGSLKPGKILFKDFMSREPDSKALLEKLGLK